jgi:hypothetical protein
MNQKLLILILFFISNSAIAHVKISDDCWTVPPYQVELPEKPILFKGELYQDASKVINIDALNEMISNDKTEKG